MQIEEELRATELRQLLAAQKLAELKRFGIYTGYLTAQLRAQVYDCLFGVDLAAEIARNCAVPLEATRAELVAAGNIHVYGPLRGRAIAGCHGDERAHIFCQSLNAELVAIAGLYQTSEMLEDAARQRCTHIYLENEKLRMEVIA